MFHRDLASGAQGAERSLLSRRLRFGVLQAVAHANESHAEAVAQVAGADNETGAVVAAGPRQVCKALVVGFGQEIKAAFISVNLSDVNRPWVHGVSLRGDGGLK
jgi:hypothetical protein